MKEICDWIDAILLNWSEALIISGLIGVLITVWIRDKIRT
jgi:hypothetical protein